jgi:hypothetical protein
LSAVFVERKVKISPMKLKIRASHATGAPIHAIASQMAGTFFSIEGEVDFSPQPNTTYVVKGNLKKEKSSVWLENAATGQPASAIVTE